MEVWRYNGRQRDGRDEAFVGGGSGSKSNSILLVVRDSTPDCHHAIACNRKRLHAIASDCMRLQAITCDLEKKPSFTTDPVLENASGMRSGTESLPKVFLHDNCEQISFIIFFAFLKKEEMRSGTRFTEQNVFLLFTVVVTNTSGRIFSPVSPKQVPDVFLPGHVKSNSTCPDDHQFYD